MKYMNIFWHSFDDLFVSIHTFSVDTKNSSLDNFCNLFWSDLYICTGIKGGFVETYQPLTDRETQTAFPWWSRPTTPTTSFQPLTRYSRLPCHHWLKSCCQQHQLIQPRLWWRSQTWLNFGVSHKDKNILLW